MVNKDYIKKVHDTNYVDNFLNGTLSEKEIRKILEISEDQSQALIS